jgi:hypothetical protein
MAETPRGGIDKATRPVMMAAFEQQKGKRRGLRMS